MNYTVFQFKYKIQKKKIVLINGWLCLCIYWFFVNDNQTKHEGGNCPITSIHAQGACVINESKRAEIVHRNMYYWWYSVQCTIKWHQLEKFRCFRTFGCTEFVQLIWCRTSTRWWRWIGNVPYGTRSGFGKYRWRSNHLTGCRRLWAKRWWHHRRIASL